MKELYGLFRKYTGAAPENAVALTGSGSNRSYIRLHGGGTSLMGVTGTDGKENNAFITLAAHFRSQGLPVPEVLAVSEDGISYLQEDLGDLLLADLVAAAHKNGGKEEGGQLEALLCRTTGLQPKIQFEGASGLDFSVC